MSLREALDIDPVDWLRRADPNSVTNASTVIDAFEGSPSVFAFTGPETFYRAAGANASGRIARAYGGPWWVSQTVLADVHQHLCTYDGWLSQQEIDRALPALYRSITALCEDWNDMSEIFRLTLPAGDRLEALVGATKRQPQVSTMNKLDPSTPWLRGGAEQIYIKVKNPLWIYRSSIS